MPSIVYYQFHEQPLWVADERVDLDGIRIYYRDISLTIQWYEYIPWISGSDLVYRLYYDNPAQVQRHNHILHGKISMNQIYVTVESHTSSRYKSLSQL